MMCCAVDFRVFFFENIIIISSHLDFFVSGYVFIKIYTRIVIKDF